MNTVAILEISSKKARLGIGSFINGSPCLMHYEEKDVSACFQSGLLTNAEALSKAIASFKHSGDGTSSSFNVSEVHLIIPPSNLIVRENHSFTRTIGETIEQIDINNALSLLTNSSKMNDYTIIDILPEEYKIDDGAVLHEAPFGKKGSSLSVKAKIHLIPTTYVAPYHQAVERAGIRTASISVSPICAANYLSSLADFPQHYFYVDIGATMTIVSLISKGALFASEIHIIGGDIIDGEVADSLLLSSQEVELIKRKAGLGARQGAYQAPIYVKRIGEEGTSSKKISIVQRQFDEALKNAFAKIDATVEAAINKIGAQVSMKPEYVSGLALVIGGGGSSLHGIESLLPLSCGKRTVYVVRPNVLGARDPALAPILGALTRRGKAKRHHEPAVEAYRGVATLVRKKEE